MTLMVKSVGFSGTYFCVGEINSIPRNIAFHTKRNHYKQTDIGFSGLASYQFVDALLDILKTSQKIKISIHSLNLIDINNL